MVDYSKLRHMEVSEDINWLKSREESVKVFLFIASKGSARVWELHKLLGEQDWWPVKAHLRALIDRGLVLESECGYEPTEHGKKVLEGFRAIERVEPLG